MPFTIITIFLDFDFLHFSLISDTAFTSRCSHLREPYFQSSRRSFAFNPYTVNKLPSLLTIFLHPPLRRFQYFFNFIYYLFIFKLFVYKNHKKEPVSLTQALFNSNYFIIFSSSENLSNTVALHRDSLSLS